MSRIESHVKALWLRGFTSDQIAKQLRVPAARVRDILADLDL